MTYTADSIVIGVDPNDMTYETFRGLQAAKQSPATDYAHGGYECLLAYHVSVAFGLAVFQHESQMATDPGAIVVTFGTNNPGNCRSSRTGDGTVINTPRGEFVKYTNWTEGWRDLAFRLVDPAYVYVQQGRRTIRQIIELFAPGSDSNDTEAYIASVVAFMNAHADQGGNTMAGDDPRFEWTPDESEFGYPQGTHGRNGNPIELLILHITVGTDSQAWLLGPNGSSTHYLTDRQGKPRSQMVADADAAWTPGSRAYAERSINVEVEMPSVNDWTDAIMRETARTIAPIMARHGIPAVYLGRDNGPGKRGMIGHADVPDGHGGWGGSGHHTDPGENFDWVTFTGYVAAELAGGQQPPPSDLRLFSETGHSIGHGFRSYWEANGGLPIFGFPLTDEVIENGMATQYFERSVFEWHPDAGVLLRRLGAEAAKSAGYTGVGI